ncbi:LIM and calponin homology domains-containing protein 1 isoform X1 [Mauremys reevesii]|uniref:LIM and calponin homology domains-containing protein 1 isoform X1 n=1 Tax=Mauremys reevesii TaxID=260615 RepID=UPI00193FF19A|nr:LIM and calponin homology domains-containing protein 1 isoform X1 [Mauremys reevesii]
MASPRLELEEIQPLQQDAARPEPAFAEARHWIEQVTGRSFGDKDFRSGLENGILLCELLNAIKPGLVKKINRLSTPIAGLDNTILFLRGCKELGLKESQLFDPGDLQDTSNRIAVKNIDNSRKLKNVLVTIYWLGKAANRCTSYSGATLNLKEFEGLLAQMRKETEDIESPKRNIRDSGYIDCWDSERSDSLSPPRHGRDDSFDSLDSFGSRSQQTPSPDVVLRGSSDGRGSDSESDLPHRKMPDVKKDDMSARRTSYGEPKSVVPFNQYLPNKSNQTAYVPAPLRKKKAEREEYRKSWSTATSPLGGEKPFSKNYPETIEEEQNEAPRQHEEEQVGCMASRTNPSKSQVDLNQNKGKTVGQFPSGSAKETAVHKCKEKDAEEIRKLRRLEQAGIKVMPAAQRYGSQKQIYEDSEPTPDIILHKEKPSLMHCQGKDSGSEDEAVCRVPDLEKDDFAARRARLNQPKLTESFNQFLVGPCTNKDKGKLEGVKKPLQKEKQEYARANQVHMASARQIVTRKENPILQSQDNKLEEEEQVKLPDIQRDDLAKRKTQSNFTQQQESPVFVKASITQADLETWNRLKVSEQLSEEDLRCSKDPEPSAEIAVEAAVHDDFASRKARAYKKASSPKQRFVHFGPVTEIDQQKWEKRSIARAISNSETTEETGRERAERQICHETFASATACSLPTIGHNNEVSRPQNDSSTTTTGSFIPEKCPQICANSPQRLAVQPQHREEKEQERQHLPDTGQDVAFTIHMSSHSLDQIQSNQTSQLQEVPERNKVVSSRDEQLQIFGPRTAVSDDAESVSMFDMRCEDEAVMQPHSKARHEKLQHIHNQLKEDEDRWQDDLARWKSRRRSASQDLIKKEAERKKMERLLSGGDGTSERRKSIKTYREIVEEKERREKELHEAYKNARSREEAESILQQYIERFTISEAVLERLEMPKILERSHSVEPNSSSPPKDPNPMRYLRQQSLPPPKYTATIEATIVPISESEATVSTGQTSPSKTVVSKAVPMLTPKPYTQPKNTQQVLKTFKVDGKVSMNGETFNGLEEKDKECTTVIFAPLLRRSPKFEGVARADGSPVELKQDTTSIELSLKRPATHTVHRELTASFTEDIKPANQKDETDSGRPEMMNSGFASPAAEQKQFKTTVTCARPAVPSVKFPPSTHSEEAASKDKDLKKPETEQQKEAAVLVTEKVVKSKAPEQEGSILFPFLKKVPETSQVILQNSDQQADSDNSDKSNRFSFWSWDPEEERKRQERWQHEQERLLQERYQKEQNKLKEEWEKAQKEVEEEERRYYEEERKIIEDTVVPFTVSSSSADPLSTSSSVTEGNGTMNMMELSNSQEEEKQKEIKRQEKLPWEQEGASLAKNKKSEPCLEKKSSVNKVPTEHPETILQRESEQDHQVSVTEHSSPVILNLPLTQDVLWSQQLLTKQSPHISEEVRQKTSLDQSIGQQDNSPGERRRTGYHENFRPGLSSPCSPTPQNHSPNRYQRSVSGKKLCSTCRLPLGKGAAMIIETLGLYFHIHCFRCGICKGQLGDAASGTDVRIRNGLLNCNDCYIRSRTAGQPTTL